MLSKFAGDLLDFFKNKFSFESENLNIFEKEHALRKILEKNRWKKDSIDIVLENGKLNNFNIIDSNEQFHIQFKNFECIILRINL